MNSNYLKSNLILYINLLSLSRNFILFNPNNRIISYQNNRITCEDNIVEELKERGKICRDDKERREKKEAVLLVIGEKGMGGSF